jgi:uncharacterized protein (TIGR03437 family)
MGKKRLLALLVFQSVAAAQPFLYYRGARNAASMLPPDHPAGAVARGSTFAIAGRNLGPVDGTLDGLAISVAQGAISAAAVPVSASASQVTGVMPLDAPLGRVSVRVTYNGRQSNAVLLNVVPSSLGFYAMNGLGFGLAVAKNLADDGSSTPNTTQTPAQPGHTVVLSATGLDAAANPVLELFVGGQPAEVVSAGAADCCVGQDEILFTLPGDVVPGCYVPVQARVNAAVVSNAVTIAISADGAACSDPFNPVSAALQAGGNIGVALPRRVVAHVESPPNPPFDVTTDWMYAALQQIASNSTYFNPLLSLPPLGTCTTFGTDQATFGMFVPPATELDGGTPLALAGPAGKASVSATPYFDALLGKTPDLAGAPPLIYAGPGPFAFSLPGGAQIGALSANFLLPPPLTWTNRDQISLVDRTQPLSVSWSTEDDGSSIILILGKSRDIPHNADGGFLCTAAPGDGAFTVPQYILGTLPNVTSAGSVSIAVGAAGYRSPQIFSAPGLDAGFVIPGLFSLRTLAIR